MQRKEKSKSGRGQRFYAVDHRDGIVFCTGFLIHKDIKMAGTTALRSHKGLHYKIHKHNEPQISPKITRGQHESLTKFKLQTERDELLYEGCYSLSNR